MIILCNNKFLRQKVKCFFGNKNCAQKVYKDEKLIIKIEFCRKYLTTSMFRVVVHSKRNYLSLALNSLRETAFDVYKTLQKNLEKQNAV